MRTPRGDDEWLSKSAATPVHTIHLKKGKYYASVKVPREVQASAQRTQVYRLSTGYQAIRTTPKELARDRTVVPEIHRRLDALFDQARPVR